MDQQQLLEDSNNVKMEDRSLVGKLLSKQTISGEVIRNAFKISWKLDKNFDVDEISNNLFLFTFETDTDITRISNQGSWIFDKFLMVLQKPMSLENLTDLDFTKAAFWVHFLNLPLRFGNAVGKFEGVDDRDVRDNGMIRFGESLRVRITIDITKPLRRVIKLNVYGSKGLCWIPMKYEGLPEFCWHCGIIGHNLEECSLYNEVENRENHFLQYGDWLRKEDVRYEDENDEDDLIFNDSNEFSFDTNQ